MEIEILPTATGSVQGVGLGIGGELILNRVEIVPVSPDHRAVERGRKKSGGTEVQLGVLIQRIGIVHGDRCGLRGADGKQERKR